MSGQDYKMTLLPGQELNKSISGDYIYCKFAERPVTVIVAGQKLEMEAGDKYRPAPFRDFMVFNDDSRPISIILTVGVGDYSRQIVQGEIEVVPGIRGADGAFRQDNRHEIKMNIVPQYPAEPTTTAEGTRLARTDRVGPNGGDTFQIYDAYIVAGRIEVINNMAGFSFNRRVFDSDFNTIENEELDFNASGKFDGTDLKYTFKRMNVPGNYIWVRSADRKSVRYFVDGLNQTLFTLPYEAPVIARIDGDTMAAFYDRNKADAVADDKFMEVFDTAGNSLYEVKASEVDQLADFETSTHGGRVTQGFYDPMNKTWTVNAWSGADQSGQNLAHYNEDFSKRLRVRYNLSGTYGDVETPGTSRKIYLVVENLLLGTPDNDDFFNKWQFNDVTEEFTANVYTSDPVNPLVRRDLPGARATYAEVTVNSAGGQTEVTGEVIRAALEIYYGAEVVGDYLDHVYAVTLSQGAGRAPFQVQNNAGTLLAAEVEDDFTAILPGVIELTVDNKIQFKETF